MSTIQLRVMSPEDLGDRHPLETPVAPAITGKGETDYVCGSCGTLLMKHVRYNQVRDLVLRCSHCGSANEVPVQH